ncbi:MAG: pyridoxamine 5'-phosphate oxidase family protein [Acidimicrobiia bacterium]|nr:pyridoxamine 5'-phosphate oxidase family protein [Acidimicrobiia bacterium]
MTTPNTEVRRAADRGRYDRETIDAILDEGLVAHVGLVQDGHPIVIPVAYARDGDSVLIHGSPASRMLRTFKKGAPACVTVTHLDGLVLARSAFHHSMNYRSVVLFGEMVEVDDPDEKMAALDRITESLVPGRSAGLRPMTEKEVKGTTVLRMAIDAASAKVRTGGPIDDEEDVELPIWAGVLPRSDAWGPPIPAEDMPDGLDVPDHVTGYGRG